MDSRYRRPGIAGPVILIALGVIFLLSNLGLIEMSFWDIIARFWPILLVAIGFDILIGHRSAWAAAMVLVVVLAILAGGIIFFNQQPHTTYIPESVEVPLRNVESTDVTLDPALGYLYVDALPQGSNALLQGEVRPFSGEDINQVVNFFSTGATIELRTEGVIVLPFFSGWSGRQPSWDLAMSPGVTTDLVVDFGVGKVELDLRDLQIKEVNADQGLGQMIVFLPSGDDVDVHLDMGIGEIRVVLLEDVGVRLTADVGIGNLNVPSSYTREGDFYLSPGYATAGTQIELEIDLGIGSVQLR